MASIFMAARRFIPLPWGAIVFAVFATLLSDPLAHAADALGFKSADEVVQWTNAYYQKPQPERIPGAVAALIADPRLSNSGTRLEPLAHFFATALQSRRALIANVGALPNQTSQAAKRFVSLVATDANKYAPASANDPGDLDLIWAEYFATGDEARLRRIAGVLDYTASRINLSSAFWKYKSINDPARALATLKATAMWSLSGNAKQHPAVKSFLQRQRASAKDAERRAQFDQMLEGRITMPK